MNRNLSGPFYIGVDVGTSSARACVVDKSGTRLGVHTYATKTFQSGGNCYEQSIQDIWQSICSSVKTACHNSGIRTTEVQSIAFSATCSLAVLARDTEQPVSVAGPNFTDASRNVVLWMHSAATEEARLINSTQHAVLRHLGGAVSPLMALAKVLWLKNNMPPELFERCKFFDLHDVLAHIATGGSPFFCNRTHHDSFDMTGFGVDGTIKGWRPDLLSEIGLGELARIASDRIGGVCEHGLPRPVGTPLGRLCSEAAKQLGLPASVTVALGVIDCYAGWIGTVGAQVPMLDIPAHERIAIVAGTSACHILVSDRSDFVRGVWGPYENFLLPDSYALVGGQSGVGRLLHHVVETHPAAKAAAFEAEALKIPVFAYLNRYLTGMAKKAGASSIPELARHVFFYGDYFGNRSPIAEAKMTGSIIGLDGDISIDNLAIMYYAAIEFLALQSRQIISTITSGNHRIRAIFLSGGLCQNRVFVDLLSSVTNLPVILPQYTHEAVCYGSALLAASAAQVESHYEQAGLWSVMVAMSKPGEVIHPVHHQSTKRLLDVKYDIMLDQARKQQEYRGMVDCALP